MSGQLTNELILSTLKTSHPYRLFRTEQVTNEGIEGLVHFEIIKRLNERGLDDILPKESQQSRKFVWFKDFVNNKLHIFSKKKEFNNYL